MSKKIVTSPIDTLRQQAEAKLSQQKEKTQPVKKTDTMYLIHELQVHQIELEMQNEELVQAQAELEATLSMYAELYAFAPAGYFTLTRDGTVRRANLTGAKLLGLGLNELVRRRFGVFVAPSSLTVFNAFLDKAFTSDDKAVCDVTLQKDESALLWVHIEGICESSREQGKLCYALVSDMRGYKQA